MASASEGYHKDVEVAEDVDQPTNTEDGTKPWGDDSRIKNKHNHFRLTTININGLPQHRSHPKYGSIREQVHTHQIDILGLSEINLKWNQFSSYDRMAQRTSKWWENTNCRYAYNSHDVSTSKFQPGGTAILSINQLSHKVRPTPLQDPTGLGRWTSTLYQGKHNTTLRILQLYRPCKPNPQSPNGVYQQHSRYFLSKKVDTCPRNLLLSDLHDFITQCLTNSEQVIVMGDFNDDVTQPPITNFFNSLQMHNVMHTLFGPQYLQSPCTYARGNSKIDAIFATQGINAIRGGMLPHHTFDSDHMALWVDLQFQSIFGTGHIQQVPLQKRRLKNEDPRIVKTFNSAYQKMLTKHHLPQASFNLMSNITNQITHTQCQEYERIDKLRVQCLLRAEKKCRKFKTGNIEFSPTIQRQRNLIRFWKLILKRKQGQKVDTKYLSRWERKLHIENSFSTPLSEVLKNIKAATSAYHCLKKEHTTLRDEWIEQLAAARAEAGRLNSANELAALRQKEKLRRAHKQIRWCLHHESSTPPITTVTEISHNTTIHHHNKLTVEKAILTANDKKYRQTNDTPPMTSLLPILGFLGVTPAATQILKGTYQPPNTLDIYTKKLLKEFAIPPHLHNTPGIDISFSPQDYTNGWSKMKEKTTSGMSNIHFGHHLACSKHLHNATFESQMCAIPYQTGYSPLRYQTSINAMLLKKAGKTDVDSLRTIVLLEPDFNFMNKKLGRDVMYHAEKNNLIAPEQFGSRKRHSAIDQVLIKTLYYDILRIKRQDGFLCSNDAKSCYDRITHSMASLALQRVGLPTPPIISMLTSLQKMQHHIRTGYGISTQSYGNTLKNGKPTQGSGQGNGASPCIWVMLSTPLLNLMRTENLGAHFKTPLTDKKIFFVGCSFVDDTDLVYTSMDSDDTLEDLTPAMQQSINTWEGGLRSTGGALVPEKSWIYPIKYVWNAEGDPKLETVDNLDIQFTVKDASQTVKTLPLTPPTVAKETLGVYLSPDGSNSTQVEYLKQKTLQWSEKVRTHHITPQNAMLSIHSTILSTLRYPAPALSLTKQEWHAITTPLHQAGLQAAGFSNKIPKAIRHGTTNNLGMHIPCMYTTQGILKLMKYKSFIQSETILGQMLRLCEETMKLELGLPGNLFSASYSKSHFLVTTSWLKNLWQFTSTHGIILQDYSPPLSTSTDNDKFIMALCINENLPRRDLIRINKCRKFLKVLTVGDLITGDGKAIITSIKYGQRSSAYTSKMHWPNQQDPGQKAWSVWRRYIKKILEVNNKLKPSLQPSYWKENPNKTQNWFYHRGLDKLFQRSNDNKWKYYVKVIHRGRQRRSPTYYYRGLFNSLPLHATPATTIYKSGHLVQFTGTMPFHTTPHTPIPTRNIIDYRNQIPPPHNQPLQDISHLDHIPHIITNIEAGNCAVVTDGSFFPTTLKSAAAFVVGNEAAHRRVIGRCFVVGPQSSFSSYRAELAGIHGGLAFIQGLCESHQITTGRIILACDNKGAITRILQGNIRLQDKHFDYISAILTILSKLTIKVEMTHVEGHKDSTMALEDLSTLERMNVIADTHAKLKADTNPPPNFDIDSEILHEWSPIKIQCEEGPPIRIHSNLDKELYQKITTQTSRSYWNSKMKIPPAFENEVNWKSLSTAFKLLTPNKKKEVLKWHSGFCGTNHMLFRRKQAASSACPGCNYPKETTTHILRCKSKGATSEWDNSIRSLQTWMRDQNAAPELIHAITTGLESWRNGHRTPSPRYSLPYLSIAFETQNNIGWGGFIHGFTAKHWESAQNLYLQYKNSKKSGSRWIAALIRKLWETIWALWRFRNSLVHDQTNTPLATINALLNITLLKEIQFGASGLPAKFNYLFQKHWNEVLKMSTNKKKQWIMTIWVARDQATPQHISIQQRHPTITSILLAWKQRIKQYEEYYASRR